MIGRHLQEVSRQPAPACEVPTAPDFITTFQCFGQFFQTILGTLTGGGFDTLATATTSLFGLLSTSLLIFGKPFPISVTLDPDANTNN